MRHSTWYTLCQVFGSDVVKCLNFLHDQPLLVDLDDERGIPFVSSEPELANRVLKFLGDIHGVRLGKVSTIKNRRRVVGIREEDKPW